MTESPTKILLGEIGPAHGIRGEVMIRTYTGTPEDIAAYGPLSSADGTRTFRVTVVRVTDKGVVARLTGVIDRTQAEALRGTELFVARHLLPGTDEREFYHADLIGLAAVDPDGKPVGEVIAVQNFGGGDLLEIRLAGSKKTELVAFNDDFVPAVDVDNRVVTVVLANADGGDSEGAGGSGATPPRKPPR